jgi:hypothetical protein
MRVAQVLFKKSDVFDDPFTYGAFGVPVGVFTMSFPITLCTSYKKVALSDGAPHLPQAEKK